MSEQIELLEKLEDEMVEVESEELDDVQQAMDYIALEEEVKRIARQDNEFDIPKLITDQEVYQVAITEAYAIAGAFRILLEAGVDYNNAVSCASNSVVGYANREQAKIQAIAQQQQTI